MSQPQAVQTLEDLEEVIAREVHSFERMGAAFKVILDGSLYKPMYPTFDAYSTKRWHMHGRYAYYHVQAADLMSLLRSHNCALLPTCELHCRQLKDLTQVEKLEVWNEVSNRMNNGQKLTARLIKQVVDERTQTEEQTQTVEQPQTEEQLTPKITVSPEEQEIINAIKIFEDTQVGELRAFILSDRGAVLNMPIRVYKIQAMLKTLELDFDLETE